MESHGAPQLVSRIGDVGQPAIKLTVHNAANTPYRDFLSRYKAFALNPGRDVVLRVALGL